MPPIFSFLLVVLAAPSAGAVPEPNLRFEAFEVTEKAPTRLAKADVNSHPLARRNRRVLERGLRKGINFAGHMTAVRIPCPVEPDQGKPGWSCTTLAIVDRRTGQVYFPPRLQEFYWDPEVQGSGFGFRPNSRLLSAIGEASAPAKRGRRAYFYEWVDGDIHLVSEIVS